MTDYNYITVDGTQFPRPVDFAPRIVDLYAGELETMSGKKQKDKIGTRYGDITLAWDWLPEEKVMALCNIEGEVILIFDDPTGDTISQKIARKSVVQKRHRYTENGVAYWRGVSVEIEFMNPR